jgi:hypothetical protein
MTLDNTSFVPGRLTVRPKNADPVGAYNSAKMQAAMDVITEDLLADYIATHLQSRGAPVGEA